MKNVINIFLGVMCLVNVVYKLVTCVSCDERFFGMQVSGIVYLIIWSVFMVMIFRGVYMDSKKVKEV